MGSTERSKKKVQLWKKAIVHFSLCFAMGFFTGFGPGGTSSSALNHRPPISRGPAEIQHLAAPVNMSLMISQSQQEEVNTISPFQKEDVNMEEEEDGVDDEDGRESTPKEEPENLLIIITPTSADDSRLTGVHLRRLAGTIRLVPAPLLWVVVERQQPDGPASDEVSQILRKTAIMYRHLVYHDNFTEPEAEMDHQRNLALRHIKQHMLAGIIHFAGLSNVYDLDFFQELRQVEVFGTWPMALLSANADTVGTVEGPVCNSSQVMGWHVKKMNNETDDQPPIHISSFAFNSSILWDPERWGRSSSSQAATQDTVKFVKEIVNEDDASAKCSRILLWSFSY
ncbi:hypothetical protein SAY87_024036 [Trapa incisa]|uniref:Glycosyltransferases n=1 Tax=Trapa incisa TaxID=236973 RepID=A0AAN7QUA8_9MYRT|nr:hypothetical protein SAY87_024036 [Trapa incisa]